jgi:hypothetical protein
MDVMKAITRPRQFTAMLFVVTALTVGAAGSAQAQYVIDTFNNSAVLNTPRQQVTFQLSREAVITQLITYHWNNGHGARPGLLCLHNYVTGAQYGCSQATGYPGSYGVQNVSWIATPNVRVPAGRYMLTDSDFNTWSWNQTSGGVGFAKVLAVAVAPYPTSQPTVGSRPPVTASSSPYPFAPCAVNSNPVAVVGPCVVARGGILNVFEVRAGIVPASLQFIANTPGSTSVVASVPLTPAGGSLFQMTVPPMLCGIGASAPGFSYSVRMTASNGISQGQIGAFTPDCR